MDQLWSQALLGMHNPKALVRAVFFVVGLHACLRGGEEHRTLRFSNFSQQSNPERWLYIENSSKTDQEAFPYYSCHTKKCQLTNVQMHVIVAQ